MFLRPPKVVFGGNGRAGRKGRELKESLVSPSVCGRWNIWSRGFPKMTRDRKYNSPPSPLPPPRQAFPQMKIYLQAGDFSSFHRE